MAVPRGPHCAVGERRPHVVYLALTLILGLAFLGIKAVEWTSKFKEHHVPTATFHFEDTVPGHPDEPVDQGHAQVFFSLYFAMTGMHALHMIIGVGLFSILLFYAWRGRYTPEYHTPWKTAACIGTLWTSSGFICFHCFI
jgi:cytochrome c oxidase subunit III